MTDTLHPGWPDRDALRALARIVAYRPAEPTAVLSPDDLAVARRLLWDTPPATADDLDVVRQCQERVGAINQWLTGALLAGFEAAQAPPAHDCPWVRWMLNLETGSRSTGNGGTQT
ncbi:hypothetical protein GCM10007036_45870 [Alsobacter metallidurans]|uniref:Uncharacterized protein n=1 Tax=Alsobacter metallidurans TaxID=340221 RepID=A0A917MJT7_9HYPH|nr:hypothetical protein [Alsobacter metallidurans]GGH33331.1 hypothetical protein GCM10007036_45870 [Alsobacter metallidurans]